MFLPSPTLGRKSPVSFLHMQSRKLPSHDEATMILSSPNQNDSSIFLFRWLWACFPYLYFDSWKPAVRQNIIVYGKRAKKEANVISYFLMTSV